MSDEVPADASAFEPPEPWRDALRQAVAPVAIFLVALPLTIFMDPAMWRNLVMKLGVPGKASVGHMWTGRGRRDHGHYAMLNFQVRKDYAETTDVEINQRAMDSLRQDQQVDVHFLTWLPGYPVLDDDYGSARELSYYFWFSLVFVVGLVALQMTRPRRSRLNW